MSHGERKLLISQSLSGEVTGKKEVRDPCECRRKEVPASVHNAPG